MKWISHRTVNSEVGVGGGSYGPLCSHASSPRYSFTHDGDRPEHENNRPTYCEPLSRSIPSSPMPSFHC